MSGLISGAGTPETAWAGWLPGRRWQALDPAELARVPLLAVAAHPDDEVLGAGGLLHALAAAGAEIGVLLATDGEASHPGSQVLTPEELGRRRREEGAAGHRALGLPAGAADWLGLPDGGLSGCVARLVEEIAARLQPGATVLAPWEHDGHPDHDAAGRAARVAATRRGGRLLAFPIWAWHWAVPDDRRLPWHRARTATLTRAARDAKDRAIAAHRSQVAPLGRSAADAPILPPPVLARFRRPVEVFFA